MPVPSKTKKLGRPLMREEVYAGLRAWIIDGTLAPGEKLRDAELAEALGVSRMPVREAFLRLEDEGFVETSANRWTRVSFVDVGQARRIYPIVIALEPLAVRLAAPAMSEADLEQMVRANERLAAALKEGDPVAASEADREFHEVLLRKAENPDLLEIMDDLKAKLRRLEVAYFGGQMVADRSVVEHEAVVEALKKGDTEEAARMIETNWRGSLERLLDQQQETAGG
jgi:DNA-binding GntR family transcriptional regulator